MKINRDDPKWTAYVLGELSHEDRAAMEQLLQTDEEALAFVEELRLAATMLKEELAAVPSVALGPEQRNAVWRAAADSLGEQYDARDTDGTFTTRVTGTTKTSVQFLKDQALGDGNKADVLVTTVTIDPGDPETTSRTGNETVGAATGNLWN